MATFNHLGLAEPSTLTAKIATVTQTRNSSVMHQEILSIGDPDSSLAIAAVLASNPASTAWGVVVRGAGPFATTGDSTVFQGTSPWTIAGNSTVVLAQGHQSSAAVAANSSALNVRVVGGASSGADFPVTVSNFSTTVSVAALPANSSLVSITQIAGGLLSTAAPTANSSGLNVWVVGGNGVSTTVSVAALPANSSQVEVRALPANSSLVSLTQIAAGYLSTAAPSANSSGLNVWVVGGNGVSTTVSIANSPTVILGTQLQSSGIPSSNSSGLIVRQVWDAKSVTASTSAFATSTQFTISASTAQQKYVTAYSLTSTDLTATVIRFMGGSTLAWAVRCQAVSSAVTGANLAVGEGYIFKTDAASSLTLNISGSSRAGWTVAVSYFLAP